MATQQFMDFLETKVSIMTIIECAVLLKSEDGENPDYDRALVELITDAARLSQDDAVIISWLIGVQDFLNKRKTK